MGQADLPVEVVARSAFDIVYQQSAPWSSQVVYPADRVTISNGAEVNLDLDQSASRLAINDGSLDML